MTESDSWPRAYGYERVSKVGARGDDLISPELQRHAIDTWALANKVHIIEHIEDLDETGRSFEKRKVKQMIAGIQEGKAEMVVLWKWSRWGRNLQQSSMYIAAVEAAGGEVRAATEDFDPKTTMGKFTRDNMLMIAELISNQIGDGWKETQEKRRRDGLPHTGNARFGYTYSRDEGYVVVEEEAVVLKDLYKRFVDGETMNSLVKDLNARGILTRNDNLWNPTGLGRMLDTGFAAGLIRERTIPGKAHNHKSTIKDFDIWREGTHAPIIDVELFDRYKAIRIANSSKPRRLIEGAHPLSGMLLCGECGGTMVSVFSGRFKKHSWTCGKRMRVRVMGEPSHAPVNISNRRALKLIRAWIESNRTDEPDMQARIQRALRATVAPVSNVENLKARVKTLEDQRTALSRMKMKNQVSDADYDALWAEVNDDLTKAGRDLDAAKALVPRAEPQPAMWDTLSAVFDQAESGELRRLLGAVLAAGVVRSGAFSDEKVLFVPAWE